MNEHRTPSLFVTIRAWWERYVVGSLERVVPDGVLWGSTTEQWAAALAVFVAAVVLLPMVKGLVRLRVQAIADRDDDQYGWLDALADAVRATRFWFLLVVAAFLATFTLELGPRAVVIVRSAVAIVLVLQAAIWANGLVNFLVARQVKRRMDKDAASVTTAKALALVGRIVLWSVAVLLVLENLGVDVTALVAGLGVGGIAVALAAQNILSDLFASLSIALDKPFVRRTSRSSAIRPWSTRSCISCWCRTSTSTWTSSSRSTSSCSTASPASTSPWPTRPRPSSPKSPARWRMDGGRTWASGGRKPPVRSRVSFLVPKLCLGTRLLEAPLPLVV